MADYSKVIELTYYNAHAYYNRGLAKSDLGQKAEAIADYQKAADLYKYQGNTSDYQEAINKIQELSAE
ncbi:tetratricopeptide repeat protein [Microcoleus sp. S36b_A4]|uniref:tetratricopeptide repeat protein n=1 Tax=Microcoleus sp. S36b_A4 TaxID=3055420 RepID=UPI004040B2D0